MALDNLTGQNIQDTYQRVVQTDGTELRNGTGSLLPISFDGNDVTISGSLTANEYIVSSSVTNITIATLSGSTDFGDDTGDTHKFTGSLFISGTYVGINNDNPNYMLDVGGDIHTTNVLRSSGLYSTFGTFTSNINANGNIVGDNGTNISGINTLNIIGNATLGNSSTDAHTVNGTLSANNKIFTSTIVEAPTGSFKKLKGDTTLATGLFVNGTITASGDISSSGDIHASTINAGEFLGTIATAAQTQITSVGTLIAGNVTAILPSGILSGSAQLPSGIISSSLQNLGNITGSNISASGDLILSSSINFGGSGSINFDGGITIKDTSEDESIEIRDETIKFKAGGTTALQIRDANNDILLGYSGIDAVWCGSGGNQLWKTDMANSKTDMVRRIRMAPSHSFTNDDGLSRLYVSGSTNLDGNVTASGNISASGDLIASSSLTLGAPLSKIIGPGGNDFMALGVDNIDIFINNGEVINIDNDSINLNSSAQAINTTITSDDGTHLVMADATSNAVRLNNSIIMSPGAPTDYTNRLLISGSTHFTGSNSHITASGNISSSATIIGNIISGSTISGSFVGDGSGLTNIPSTFTSAGITGSFTEASASFSTRVTANDAKLTANTTNVTNAGALMDSEVDADIKTLALPASTTISTFGASLIDDAAASNARTTLGLGTVATTAASAYATSAQGTKADSAQQPPSEGAFANGDKTKLDGIATGATANAGDATLSGTQTFSGDKSFTGAVTASGITIEGPISASGANGYIIAKTPVIVLNTTDVSTDMYIDYSNTPDGSGGTLAIALGGTQIPWDKQEIIDTSFFTHDTSTNNERIYVTYSGRYEIIFSLTYNKDSARACPVVRPYVDGSWGGFRFQSNPMYQRATGANNNSLNGSYIMELDAGDYFSLASGYVANFGAAPSGGGMNLQRYNTTHGYSKLMIKMIG